MSYADVAEVAFSNGPPWFRRFSSVTRQTVLWLLFVTYFGTCSVYTVIIATNFQQLYTYHMDVPDANIRYFIAALLVPLILLSYVPNLKYLAPVSMVANLLMAGGLGVTFYYLLKDMESVSNRPHVASLETFPAFFCLTVFAMEAIGVVSDDRETSPLIVSLVVSRARGGDGTEPPILPPLQSYVVLSSAGDAAGEQHENAETLFGIFRRAQRRHGRRDRRVHIARFPRLSEVRRSDSSQHYS